MLKRAWRKGNPLTLVEGEGGMFQENSIETCIVSRVKQITSPGWMHETSARTWCTEKTQEEWVEREVGGGIGMGNTCKPMAVSFQCMTKFTTNKKKKLVQPLQRTLWRFLKKLEIKLPYNPEIPLLGIHTQEIRIGKNTGTPVHCSTVYRGQDMEATQMALGR